MRWYVLNEQHASCPCPIFLHKAGTMESYLSMGNAQAVWLGFRLMVEGLANLNELDEAFPL